MGTQPPPAGRASFVFGGDGWEGTWEQKQCFPHGGMKMCAEQQRCTRMRCVFRSSAQANESTVCASALSTPISPSLVASLPDGEGLCWYVAVLVQVGFLRLNALGWGRRAAAGELGWEGLRCPCWVSVFKAI